MGVSVAYLKEKTTKRQADAVEIDIEVITPIPPEIIKNRRNIMDIMDVCNVI